MMSVHTRSTYKENLSTAVLENYHSLDHCLLSKWKRCTCQHTYLSNMTEVVYEKSLPDTSPIMTKIFYNN